MVFLLCILFIKLFIPLIMGILVCMLFYRFNSYSWKQAAKESLLLGILVFIMINIVNYIIKYIGL
ncbi:hypothetical protein GGR09_000156 [Bartonella heixiaziensis]